MTLIAISLNGLPINGKEAHNLLNKLTDIMLANTTRKCQNFILSVSSIQADAIEIASASIESSTEVSRLEDTLNMMNQSDFF